MRSISNSISALEHANASDLLGPVRFSFWRLRFGLIGLRFQNGAGNGLVFGKTPFQNA